MPEFTVEYHDFGYRREFHVADSQKQVREYFESEMPWRLPILILEVPNENEPQ